MHATAPVPIGNVVGPPVGTGAATDSSDPGVPPSRSFGRVSFSTTSHAYGTGGGGGGGGGARSGPPSRASSKRFGGSVVEQEAAHLATEEPEGTGVPASSALGESLVSPSVGAISAGLHALTVRLIGGETSDTMTSKTLSVSSPEGSGHSSKSHGGLSHAMLYLRAALCVFVIPVAETVLWLLIPFDGALDDGSTGLVGPHGRPVAARWLILCWYSVYSLGVLTLLLYTNNYVAAVWEFRHGVKAIAFGTACLIGAYIAIFWLNANGSFTLQIALVTGVAWLCVAHTAARVYWGPGKPAARCGLTGVDAVGAAVVGPAASSSVAGTGTLVTGAGTVAAVDADTTAAATAPADAMSTASTPEAELPFSQCSAAERRARQLTTCVAVFLGGVVISGLWVGLQFLSGVFSSSNSASDNVFVLAGFSAAYTVASLFISLAERHIRTDRYWEGSSFLRLMVLQLYYSYQRGLFLHVPEWSSFALYQSLHLLTEFWPVVAYSTRWQDCLRAMPGPLGRLLRPSARYRERLLRTTAWKEYVRLYSIVSLAICLSMIRAYRNARYFSMFTAVDFDRFMAFLAAMTGTELCSAAVMLVIFRYGYGITDFVDPVLRYRKGWWVAIAIIMLHTTNDVYLSLMQCEFQ